MAGNTVYGDYNQILSLQETIRNLKTEIEKLRVQVFTDELTGTFNYRYLMSRLEEERSRSVRYSRDLSLIMLDLDGLKQINDTYGHHMGNLVLIETTKCIKEALRGYDIVARFGGDEFAVMLPDTSLENASKVAERILENIQGLSHMDSVKRTSFKASISCGVAFYDDCTKSSTDLIVHADLLLYEAKRAGKNCIEYGNVSDKDFLLRKPHFFVRQRAGKLSAGYQRCS
ncbi:MAG: GGDEF domain-containing protein [Candidatus Eremiobacteraeota bacterium]|nr:GGDEF domain-containing protein [Candidatus Eremiobacteraeota bacterium]